MPRPSAIHVWPVVPKYSLFTPTHRFLSSKGCRDFCSLGGRLVFLRREACSVSKYVVVQNNDRRSVFVTLLQNIYKWGQSPSDTGIQDSYPADATGKPRGFYSSRNITGLRKSRTITRERHVACCRERGNAYGVLKGVPEGTGITTSR
jgi:hypothetical protein